MRKQAGKQAFENNSMEVTRQALGKRIARWAVEGGRIVTAIPAFRGNSRTLGRIKTS